MLQYYQNNKRLHYNTRSQLEVLVAPGFIRSIFYDTSLQVLYLLSLEHLSHKVHDTAAQVYDVLPLPVRKVFLPFSYLIKIPKNITQYLVNVILKTNITPIKTTAKKSCASTVTEIYQEPGNRQYTDFSYCVLVSMWVKYKYFSIHIALLHTCSLLYILLSITRTSYTYISIMTV